MKIGKILLTALLFFFLATGAYAYTWDQIDLENTYGTGNNTALLVVDFSEGPEDSFAWKINFSGDSIGSYEILEVVADNDTSFTTVGEGWITQINYGSYSGTEGWWMNNLSYDLGETWTYDYGDPSDGQAIVWKSGMDFAYGLATPETPTVPVPAAVWLLGSGLIGLVGLRRRNAN